MAPQLSRRRKRQIALLTLLTVLAAFAEFVSLGAILPFLAALVAPDEVLKYPVISQLVEGLDLRSSNQVVLLFALLFVVLMLVTSIIRLALSYGNMRIAVAIGAEFSSEAYRRTLYQPYQEFVKINSSVLVANIDKSNTVANGFVHPILTILSSLAIVVAILVGLLIVDPAMTLVVSFLIGGSYGLIAWYVKWHLEKNGQIISNLHTRRIKSIQESLGNFRGITLAGTQEIYSQNYKQNDRPVRWAQGVNALLITSPRIGIEAIGAVVLAGVAYFASLSQEGVSGKLPVLGALVFGAQRLIPAFQQIYGSWSTIVGGKARVLDSLELLEQEIPDQIEQGRPAPLGIEHAISMENVRFRYANEEPWVLDGVDLEIHRGERIGIVGRSGEGKSTLLDLLMGLLLPTEGELRVDGHPIQGHRLKAWQESIAHVSQEVFLADLSLAANITLGVPPDMVAKADLEESVEQSGLGGLVVELPDGYETLMGERGARLSGGQRQRIGIARALYRRRSVLILDEATSALDSDSELQIQEMLRSLDRELTIVLVAHRESSTSFCDRRFLLAGGRIEEIQLSPEAQLPLSRD